jgi:hypothetical protein
VVNAASTARYRPVIEAINQDRVQTLGHAGRSWPGEGAAASGETMPVMSYREGGMARSPATMIAARYSNQAQVLGHAGRSWPGEGAATGGETMPVYAFQSGGIVPSAPVITPMSAPAGRATEMKQIRIEGDINIVIPESAAPQRPEDWRYITREFIIPEIRKAGAV